jgi:pteridine reductase
MKLHGRRVLITGGRRLGSRLAIALAERGCDVALSYHSQRSPVETTAAACQQHGVRTWLHQADLRDPTAAAGLVEAVVQAWGGIDILLNLTSIYRRTPFKTLTVADSLDLLGSNLLAPYWVSVAVAQQMLQQPMVADLQGKIVHFTDWAVDRPYRDFLPYQVGKGGIVTLTKTLAVELAPTITVNAIAPGTVEPPPHLSAAQLEQIRTAAALQRIGSPDDIVAATLLIVAETDFMTGEVLRLDGGRFLGATNEPGDVE